MTRILADGVDGFGYLLHPRVAAACDFLDARSRVADVGTLTDSEVIGQLFGLEVANVFWDSCGLRAEPTRLASL